MVNATIFPVFDEEMNEIVEYMAVRFMITEDEIKKRNFQKNVIINIQKQKETELKKKIKEFVREIFKIFKYQRCGIITRGIKRAKKKNVENKKANIFL